MDQEAVVQQQRKRAAEAEDHRAKIEAILDQQQKALAKVQAEAADRLARAEELAAERVARAEARVAKAEADIREVEKNTRHWTMTAESDYKAMEERFIARVEAMEKQLQVRGGAGGTVPLGDSNFNKPLVRSRTASAPVYVSLSPRKMTSPKYATHG